MFCQKAFAEPSTMPLDSPSAALFVSLFTVVQYDDNQAESYPHGQKPAQNPPKPALSIVRATVGYG